MKLIENAVKEYTLPFWKNDEEKALWIIKFRCPNDLRYNDIVKCEEGKYDCHKRTCWDIEVEE